MGNLRELYRMPYKLRLGGGGGGANEWTGCFTWYNGPRMDFFLAED